MDCCDLPSKPLTILKYEYGIRRSFDKNEIRPRDLSKTPLNVIRKRKVGFIHTLQGRIALRDGNIQSSFPGFKNTLNCIVSREAVLKLKKTLD